MYILSSSHNELIKVSRIQDSTVFTYTSVLSEEHALSSALFPGKQLVTLHDIDLHHLFEVFLAITLTFTPDHANSSNAICSSKKYRMFRTILTLRAFNPSGMTITLSFIPKGTKHMSMYSTHLYVYGCSLSTLQDNEMLE